MNLFVRPATRSDVARIEDLVRRTESRVLVRESMLEPMSGRIVLLLVDTSEDDKVYGMAVLCFYQALCRKAIIDIAIVDDPMFVAEAAYFAHAQGMVGEFVTAVYSAAFADGYLFVLEDLVNSVWDKYRGACRIVERSSQEHFSVQSFVPYDYRQWQKREAV